MSKLAEEMLKESFRRETELPGMTYLMPEINEVFAKGFKEMDDKFSRLLARTALEAGATKRMLMHLYVVSGFNTPKEVDDLEEVAWRYSERNLYNPLKSIEEYVAELESRRRQRLNSK